MSAVLPRPGVPISRSELFLAFFRIGILGFGGIAVMARRVIVEERRWYDERSYAELLAAGQVLPGANTVNMAAIIGDRAQGTVGALLALAGLLVAPLVILVGIALLYDRYSDNAVVDGALSGTAAAAAGMVTGTAVKMLMRLKMGPIQLGFALGAAALVGLASFPLVPVALVLGTAGIAIAWRMR